MLLSAAVVVNMAPKKDHSVTEDMTCCDIDLISHHMHNIIPLVGFYLHDLIIAK